MNREVEAWLAEAGYIHHCFVSWPHTINPEIGGCARAIKIAIENELAYSIARPSVFLDEAGITGGDAWEERIRLALCHSVSMVALCAPIYYHPDHAWCGREWAGMTHLGAARLGAAPFGAIIPVLMKERRGLPAPVAAIQYIDFTRVTIQGRRFYSTNEFRAKMAEVVRRVEEIAVALHESKSTPNCDSFKIPNESAFAGTNVPPQAFPFRGSH